MMAEDTAKDTAKASDNGAVKGSVVDLRSMILATADIPEEIVYVKEWDAKVLVKGMTGRERASALAKYLNEDSGRVDYESMYPEIVIAATYHPDTGALLFDPADGEVLKDKSAGALETVASAIMRLSGLSKDADKEAGKGS